MRHLAVWVVALELLKANANAVKYIKTACSQHCKTGLCSYDDCKSTISCPGGKCRFANCLNPTCGGGACSFFSCLNPTCGGGGCKEVACRHLSSTELGDELAVQTAEAASNMERAEAAATTAEREAEKHRANSAKADAKRTAMIQGGGNDAVQVAKLREMQEAEERAAAKAEAKHAALEVKVNEADQRMEAAIRAKDEAERAAANAMEEANPGAEAAEAEEKSREIERSAAFAKEPATLPERASAAPAAIALSSSVSEERPGSAEESLDETSATASATPAGGGGDVGAQPEHDDALRSQLFAQVPR